MKKTKINDSFLEKRLVKYDEWLSKERISCSSKVIPISESLDVKQWVLPTERAMGILHNAKSIAVQNCECRVHYKRCDNPLEVCLLMNEVGDKFVSKGEARHVSLIEAAEILKKANKSGLVHLTLYQPNHEIYALCSCCLCCCHELQIVKLYGRNDLMVQSDYIAVTDFDFCSHCGECIERCIFGARAFIDDKMEYNPNVCLGCGLCVTICPVATISMQLRESQIKT